MDFMYEQLSLLQKQLQTTHTAELEKNYYDLCIQLAGEAQAIEIKKIDLTAYTEALENGLKEALLLADEQDGKAIYFEYDLDNHWSSTFFICEEYYPLEEEDDDWACEWSESVDGSDLESFATIYTRNGFDDTDIAIGSTLYLIARTVGAYKQAVDRLETTPRIPICIAYHDQDPIYRVC